MLSRIHHIVCTHFYCFLVFITDWKSIKQKLHGATHRPHTGHTPATHRPHTPRHALNQVIILWGTTQINTPFMIATESFKTRQVMSSWLLSAVHAWDDRDYQNVWLNGCVKLIWARFRRLFLYLKIRQLQQEGCLTRFTQPAVHFGFRMCMPFLTCLTCLKCVNQVIFIFRRRTWKSDKSLTCWEIMAYEFSNGRAFAVFDKFPESFIITHQVFW